MNSISPSLSNIQQELIKLYSFNLPENDLKNIKSLIANYFAQKAIEEADRIWEEKKYDNNLMQNWANNFEK
jgi:hypothetical protein